MKNFQIYFINNNSVRLSVSKRLRTKTRLYLQVSVSSKARLMRVINKYGVPRFHLRHLGYYYGEI